MRVGIVGGKGVVGSSYNLVFPDAYIYDVGVGSKDEINACDIALVCVPTNLNANGELDMSIEKKLLSGLIRRLF